MNVIITLTTAGINTGPFDLYSNIDGYVIPFANNVDKTALVAGYNSSVVPNGTTTIRVKSDGIVIADAGVFQMKLATNKYFELIIDFTVTKIGGVGVAELFVNGQYAYNQNANTNLDGINFALVSNTTFDTTISNTLTITAEWGASDIGNSIQSQNFVLTKVY